MTKLMNTFFECDMHVAIVTDMMRTQDTIPLFYEVAITEALRGASNTMILYFYRTLYESCPQAVTQHFTKEAPFTIEEIKLVSNGTIKDLKDAL